jgi:hypothetical protein
MRAKRRMAERLLDPDSITSEDPRIIVAEIEAGLFEQRGGVDRQRQVDGHGEKGKAAKKGGDEKVRRSNLPLNFDDDMTWTHVGGLAKSF